MKKMGRRLVMVVVGAALCWVGQAAAAPGGIPLCQTNLATCSADLNTSNANLATCTADVNACDAALAAAQQFPATGQTAPYTAGDDGAIQAGATLSYTDNGDGTITDNNTKLVWEKKSDDGSIHDRDTNWYTWFDAFEYHIAGLNTAAFAGHTDWRLPNIKELQSIVNYETLGPAVSPAFNTGCVASCSVLTCSCTAAAPYWSSTTGVFPLAFPVSGAWVLDFVAGGVNFVGDKGFTFHVRAVRGGL